MIHKQAQDIHAGQAIFEAKNLETDAVKTGQAIVCAQPQIAVPCLRDGVDSILWQAGFGSP